MIGRKVPRTCCRRRRFRFPLLIDALAQLSAQPVIVCYDCDQCEEGNYSKCVVAEKVQNGPRANCKDGSGNKQKEAIFHWWRFSASEPVRRSDRAVDTFELWRSAMDDAVCSDLR